MSNDRVKKIESLLQDRFSPEELLVKDQSHLHAGHEGAKDGRGHFEVTIKAKELEGKSRIDSHRLIYDVLRSRMETDIHALKINVR